MRVSEGSDTFEFRSPHGMKAAHSRLRTFAGIAVRHLQHFNHPGRAWHDLSGPQDTLTVMLAEIGGKCEARTNLHRPAALERQRPHHISFVPAEMRVWGYTDNVESVRELRLSFDRKSLGDWFGPDLDPGRAGNPELMFRGPSVGSAMRLPEEIGRFLEWSWCGHTEPSVSISCAVKRKVEAAPLALISLHCLPR
jgi:AraC family transcriptional regulator